MNFGDEILLGGDYNDPNFQDKEQGGYVLCLQWLSLGKIEDLCVV